MSAAASKGRSNDGLLTFLGTQLKSQKESKALETSPLSLVLRPKCWAIFSGFRQISSNLITNVKLASPQAAWLSIFLLSKDQ